MSFAKLSRDSIVNEAIELMKTEGLEQVTLRNVAARLDARAPSLYRHIADKRALYALMSEKIIRECLAATPESACWQDWLRGFGHALWNAQSGNTGVLRLIQARAQEDSVSMQLREQIVETLVGLGQDRGDALMAQRSVMALVTGWTTLSRRFDPLTGKDELFTALDALIDGWSNRKRAN